MAPSDINVDSKDDKRQTVLLIGILLVLIIVVGGALLFILVNRAPLPPEQTGQNTTPPPPSGNGTIPANVTNVTPQCDDSCLQARAVQESNVSECQLISDNSIKQGCFAMLSNVSIDACTAQDDAGAKALCVTAFAVSGNDIGLCDLLASGADECRVAVDACYGSSDRKLCSALEDKDPALCGQDSACLLNFSVALGNASSCSLIQNAALSKACASAVTGSDHCSDLGEEAQENYCYQIFAIYSDDYLTCTQIDPASIYALDCYSTFAARLNNLSICDMADLFLNDRWACYTNFSLLTGNLTGCRSIPELAPTHTFDCAFSYAKKFGDPSACEVITENSVSVGTCYQGAIIYSNANLNWQYCNKITNFVWMNKCYSEAAKLYHDSSICDKISDAPSRDSCKSSFALNQTQYSSHRLIGALGRMRPFASAIRIPG